MYFVEIVNPLSPLLDIVSPFTGILKVKRLVSEQVKSLHVLDIVPTHAPQWVGGDHPLTIIFMFLFGA
jgi:hypothetical protein